MNIIQKPGALSLSMNMNTFVIGSTQQVSFVLKKGGEELVSQLYAPSANNVVEIDVHEIVHQSLSCELKDASAVYPQPNLVADFTAVIDTTEVAFRVIRSGVDRLADSAADFLTQNFLTWQPSVKGVTYYSPEYLSYYAVVAGTAKLRAYFTDDNGGVVSQTDYAIAELAQGVAYTMPLQYAVVAGWLGNKLPGYYDVWVESTSGQRLTYIQRYYAENMKSEQEQWILFENSLGGVDTFRAYGSNQLDAEHTHNLAEVDEVSREYRVDTERKHRKNSGYLNKEEARWLLDFFPSQQKYIYIGNYLRRIVVVESDVTGKLGESPVNYTFAFKYADARPLLNLPRTDTPADVLDITVPEVGSFTIPPRLAEFSRLPLSEGVLFPVQHPYSEEWGTTTAEAIGSFLAYFFSKSAEGGIGHKHTNLDLLQMQSYIEEYLLVGGKKIKAGYADKAGAIEGMDDKYLRKDQPDTAQALITFAKGLLLGKYVPGANGGAFTVDLDTGQTFLEVDKLLVRMSAYFEKLTLMEKKSIEGELIVTKGGGARILKVWEKGTMQVDGSILLHDNEPIMLADGNKLTLAQSVEVDNDVPDGVWRCFFLAEEDGREVDNKFRAGMQLISQDFNVSVGVHGQVSNHYYWRLCVGASINAIDINGKKYHYVDISKSDADTSSNVPCELDLISHLGARTKWEFPAGVINTDNENADYQDAIIISSTGSFSPSLTIYKGIDSYSYLNKEYISFGVDKTSNKAFMNVYGDMYVGDREGNTFIRYTQEDGVEVKGKLAVGTKLGDGTTIEDALDNATQAAIDTANENIADFAGTVTKDLEEIQKQIDGAIETWFAEPVPTLSNYPASGWTTAEERNIHLGDLYYSGEGKAYRFQMQGDAYLWQVITDSDITKALADAAKAQDTADGKRTVFIKQPTDSQAYQVGDLWVNATYGSKYKDDMLRAVTAKVAGVPFSINHWTLASKYTDDTKANEVQKNVDNLAASVNDLSGTVGDMRDFTDEAFSDGVIDRSEASAIAKYINTINTTKADVANAYGKVYENALLDGVPKTNLKKAYDAFNLAAGELTTAVNDAIADNVTTSAERALVDGKYEAFNLKYGDFVAALNVANKYIQDKINANASDALEQIGGMSYLTKALKEQAQIEGGLILASVLALGYTDGTAYKVMSGTNGIYDKAALGGGIASWWGGAMKDRGNYTDLNMPSDVAKAVIRMNGSGYLADGAIWWGTDGKIHADPQSFLINENQLGDYLELFQIIYKDAEKHEIDYMIPQYVMQKVEVADSVKIGNAFLKYDSKNNAIYVEGVDGVQAGFYSTGFLSALGVNPNAGGGGASALTDLVDVNLNSPSKGQVLKFDGTHWVNAADEGITKIAWEDVTGKPNTFAPSAHTHNYASTVMLGTMAYNIVGNTISLPAYPAPYTHPTVTAKTIEAANGRVLSAITVSNLGHVTSVAYKALVANDIPALAISKITGLQAALDSKLNRSVFDELFEKVNIGTSSAPVYAIRAKYGLYSDGFVSAKGVNPNAGGGGGASALTDLVDVILTNPSNGQVLKFDGTHWVNAADEGLSTISWESVTGKPNTFAPSAHTHTIANVTGLQSALDGKSPTSHNHDTVYSKVGHTHSQYLTSAALTGYATEAWVTGKKYATVSELDARIDDLVNGAPAAYDTLKEIADVLAGNVDSIGDILTELSTKANKAIKISAGTGLAGGGTLEANRTLSLAVSGVAAGTYAKVTVDTYGRVTKGASLIASDIPDVSGKYVTLDTAQTITGVKKFSADAASVMSVDNTGVTSTSNFTAILFRHGGERIGGIAANKGTNYLYRANVDFTEVYTLLDTHNYTDTLDGRYLTKAFFARIFGIQSEDGKDILINDMDAVIDAIRVKYGLYSDSYVSAKGKNSNAGGGGGTQYDRLDSWSDYTADKAGYVLSAKLGYDLYTSKAAKSALDAALSRIASLEGGSAMGVTTTGSGNAITALSKSGTLITATKGNTFVDLAAAQTITGAKRFNADITLGGSTASQIVLKMAVDTSNFTQLAKWVSAADETKIAFIGYHNTAKRIILNPIGSDEVWNDTVGKYNLVVGSNELTYNTYKVLHAGNYTSVLNTIYSPISHTHNYASTVKVGATSYSVASNTVSLPAYPTSLKSPHAITIKRHGVSLGSYDGSAAKSFDIAAPAWGEVTGKPTTLGGYGITDAYTKTDSDSRFLWDMNRVGVNTNLNDINVNGFVRGYQWTNSPSNAAIASVISLVYSNDWITQIFSIPHENPQLYVRSKYSGTTWGSWKTLLHSGNYTDYLDVRYVNVSGDTMTGALTISSTKIKMMLYDGDVTAYSPASGGWARGHVFRNNANTETIGFIGAYGLANSVSWLGFGKSFNETWMEVSPSHTTINATNSIALFVRSTQTVGQCIKISDMTNKGAEVGWWSGLGAYFQNEKLSSTPTLMLGAVNSIAEGLQYRYGDVTYNVWHEGNSRATTHSVPGSWDCNAPAKNVYQDYGSADRQILNTPSEWNYGCLYSLINGYGNLNSSLCAQFMWDVQHNTDNSGLLWFRTRDSIKGWKKWTSVVLNNGSNYNIGANHSSFLTVHDTRDTAVTPNGSTLNNTLKTWFSHNDTPTSTWWSGITVKGWTDGYVVWQLAGYSSTDHNVDYNLRFRTGISNTWKAWRTLATLTDNVASATKLQTARSIWGQSFDGTGNVSGALSGATTITASGNIISTGGLIYSKAYGLNSVFGCQGTGWCHLQTDAPRFHFNKGISVFGTVEPYSGAHSLGSTTAPFGEVYSKGWYRTIGTTGWYSQTYGGGWYMTDTIYIRNYNNKRLRIDGINDYFAIHLPSGGICRDAYDGASWANGYGLINQGIVNNSSQTPLIVAYRVGTSLTGADRLLSMELLNSGTNLRFYFGGTSRFEFLSNGTLYAQNLFAYGAVTAKSTSDLRLKTNFDCSVNYQDRLLALGSVMDFNYNKHAISRDKAFADGKRHTGLVYQQAIKAGITGLCHPLDDDGYGSINYLSPDLLCTVIGAVQMGIKQMRTHETRLEKLERELKDAKNEIKKLKLMCGYRT